ncbi:MAG: class I SAM-dependent methyltransferase [Cyanothece sp. SIO2G6]|nr:class I SAM-dependent methyltransferase [Cyanothece sp. SIO2G6]
MFEEKPQSLQQRVTDLAAEALQSGQPATWFEPLYQQAQGDTGQVPWAKLEPHPYLQEWLEVEAIQGKGQSVLVIGCGLGDDAELLAKLGFKVTAFDVAPTAIAWCQQRFPNSSVDYQVADLFKLPQSWQQRFDLVVEIRDIQALPLSVRTDVIKAVASPVAVAGTLFIVTRIRDHGTIPDGPPWPLSDQELAQLHELGLKEHDRVQFTVSEQPEVRQVRLVYQRITA